MSKTSYRCAVYTRKSHEEGLDQEFNSLDAQLEACRSYIASQSGMGWSYRETRYDDGGISGGHMNRPALQALVSDVKAGLIDIIVVYKVDRLTRSLADFAKLVDVFDEHDVSFVSVTQAFNTTTSMGRLTLNVLLSFAQFEREVTAERIRDKIKASKKRGMWMGGTVPLGYSAKDQKLYPNIDEALVIETLFKLYAKHKTVSIVAKHASELGLTTRPKACTDGELCEGKAFTRGHIYYILKNPTYIGKIKHKAVIHDGNHDPIIDIELWETVQAILKANKAGHNRMKNSQSAAVLSGLLFDEHSQALVPHYSMKSGKRYHYYVSQSGEKHGKWRLAAGMLEDTIYAIIKDICQNPRSLTFPDQCPPHFMMKAIEALEGYKTSCSDKAQFKDLVHQLIDRIILRQDRVAIDLSLNRLLGDHAKEVEGFKFTHSKMITLRRRGHELKIALGSDIARPATPNAALIKIVSQSYALRNALETRAIASIKDYALQNHIDPADAKRLLPLSYLAPDIVKAILAGQQPVDLTAQLLKDSYKLPITWAEQREYLGFSA